MALVPIHNYFVFNGILKPVSDFIISENEGGIYEVLRVQNRIPLFLEDHLKRFSVSAKIANKVIRFGQSEVEHFINQLINKNKISEGNILISCKTNLKIFYIPHTYPTSSMYESGVSCGILKAEREHPNAKVFQTTVRHKANKLIESNNFYEVLLVDEKEFITEGSRSNVFFVENGKIYTPPGNKVLRGITREKTIDLALESNVPVLEKNIRLSDLIAYEAAFVTGTSPKILPIYNIGQISFNVNNETVRKIMDSYNILITRYINRRTKT